MNYTANAAQCGVYTARTLAECGETAAICTTEIIADGVECGWNYIEVAWCWLTDSCDREPKSCPVTTCDYECELPSDCSRDELQATNVTIPEINFGHIRGSVSVTLSHHGLFTVPDLDYCPLGGACQFFDPSNFTLASGAARLCGPIPGLGQHCLDLCDLLDLPDDHPLCDEGGGQSAASPPLGVPVRMQIGDANLALHVQGPQTFGTRTTLAACPEIEGRQSCQWIIEPSPTRPEAYYLRSPGTDLCLHMHGGNQPDAYGTLRTCNYAADLANYQYLIRPSPTHAGAFTVRAVDAGQYVHAAHGSHVGAAATYNHCGGHNGGAGNCQWRFDPAPRANVPVRKPVFLRAVQSGDPAFDAAAALIEGMGGILEDDLSIRVPDGQTFGNATTLGACATNTSDLTCKWVFEPSPTRPGHYYIRNRATNMCLHMHGGNLHGSYGTLRTCNYAADLTNYQYFVEPSGTRPGLVYIKAAGSDLYLHASGGDVQGASVTLHHCPKNNDHPNCQWRLDEAPAVAVPTRQPAYVRAGNSNLAMHAAGGQANGNAETLHACPENMSDPNCQWIFEPSPTRPDHVWLRSRGTDLCLHMHGGNWPGSYGTLRPCNYAADLINYQYLVEPSPTRPGLAYIKVTGSDLYLHASGGIHDGASVTLHACPKGNDHINCQWRIE